MKTRGKELLFLYLILDLIILNSVIYLMSYYSTNANKSDEYLIGLYYLNANLSWIITYFTFAKKNLYLREGFSNRAWSISRRMLIYMAISTMLAFLFLPHTYSRVFLVQYSIVFYISILLFYWLLYYYLKFKREKGRHTNRVIIVGVNETSQILRRLIDSNPMLGYRFVGFLSKNPDKDPDVIGKPDELEALIKKNSVEMVFVTVSLISQTNKTTEFLGICNHLGVRLRIVPENQQLSAPRMDMETIGNLVMINPQEVPLDLIQSRFLKRLLDIVFSISVILFVFSWLFPLIAILIKLSSKGPVFFIQDRTGFNNRTFKCIKFRSMKVNPDADHKQATAGDSRITRIGRFIRHTNIDEFPQFLNVLKGDMSVVGPRPHMLKHTKEYSKRIDQYLVRHYVKPGVTGWAQVNGYRGETDELWKMEKRVEYDMEYIKNWNFWLDIEIIFKTIFDKKTYFNAG